MDKTTLAVEWVPLDRLRENPANPRRNDAAVPHVAASLKRFGWRQPLVAKPDGELIAGHTRWKAARSLSMREVPVVWFEGSALEATAFGIADNRTAEFAEWDEGALAQLLAELRDEDALDGVGFDEADIDALLAELEDSAPRDVDDPGPPEPAAVAVSRPGDLWLLGEHRLLCGDSTQPASYARVLAGERAQLLSTDPPYCVDYDGTGRPGGAGKDWSHVYREKEIPDLGVFLEVVLDAALPQLAEDAAIYMWHAHVKQPVIAGVFERKGLLLHQVIVWTKPVGTFGHSHYRWRHEPCAFGWQKGHKPRRLGAQLDTVWEADWEGKARPVGAEHPTQKPTRVFEIPMEQHTTAREIVLEPFSGSGSQIIAAEKLRRRCCAIEKQPVFVDVAIRRWQLATGQEAKLEAGGATFAEVTEERGP
ncbi:MAG: DNA methyltransferase [Planctomycetota bacterium]